jgi:hypothetical protein
MKTNLRFAFLIACAMAFLASCSGGDKTTTTPATTTDAAGSSGTVPASTSFTGTYDMDNGVEAGKLEVDESNTGIKFRLTAHAGNEAEAEFTGNLEEDGAGGYRYPDDACQIGFKFSTDGCDVKYNADPIGCGVGDGAADVTGFYKKTSNAKPAI